MTNSFGRVSVAHTVQVDHMRYSAVFLHVAHCCSLACRKRFAAFIGVPAFLVPAFSGPAFFTPYIWFRIFRSCIFWSCIFSDPVLRLSD